MKYVNFNYKYNPKKILLYRFLIVFLVFSLFIQNQISGIQNLDQSQDLSVNLELEESCYIESKNKQIFVRTECNKNNNIFEKGIIKGGVLLGNFSILEYEVYDSEGSIIFGNRKQLSEDFEEFEIVIITDTEKVKKIKINLKSPINLLIEDYLLLEN